MLTSCKEGTTCGKSTSIFYAGSFGNLGHTEVGGQGRARVENGGGRGTSRGHWSETEYDVELMTGFVEQGSPMPMSRMTVRSLEDIGYQVKIENAEPYHVPASSVGQRKLRSSKHRSTLEGDLLQTLESITVDAQGNILL